MMELVLGQTVFDLKRPLVMGVLNVTPDSFSDGGQFFDVESALRHVEAMQEGGAAIVDVGGESTRPGAAAVSEVEEIERVLPLIEAISRELDLHISIDTSKPEVMRAAVDAGASMVNDVYALRRDGAMETVAGLGITVCLMHMQGEPRTMQKDPHYDDVLTEVLEFLANSVRDCREAGIADNRLVVDPGFGFGKTDIHNLELMANLERFTELGLPLLVGLSRKRTLGILSGKAIGERMAAGLAAAVLAVDRGANIVRTHDVAAMDINGDNWLDLVVGSCGGTMVLINQPPAPPAGEVPDGSTVAGDPLRLAKAPSGQKISLTWGASCAAADSDSTRTVPSLQAGRTHRVPRAPPGRDRVAPDSLGCRHAHRAQNTSRCRPGW